MNRIQHSTRALTLTVFFGLLLAASHGHAEVYPYHLSGGEESGNWLYTSAPYDQLLFGDFNGDGETDVFWANPNNNWYIRYSQPGTHHTADWQHVSSSSAPIEELSVGDVNGDGQDDILWTNGSGWHYRASATASWALLRGSSVGRGEFLLGDFNGDGLTDLLYPTSAGLYVSWQCNSSWSLLQTTPTPYTADQLAVGDFDNDGKDDILVADGETWQVRDSDSGAWSTRRHSDTTPRDFVVGDFNSTPGADVLVADGQVWTLFSGGLGAGQAVNTSGVLAYQMVPMDVDNDQRTDIMVNPAALPAGVGGEQVVMPAGGMPLRVFNDGATLRVEGNVTVPGPFGDVVLTGAALTFALDSSGAPVSMHGTAEVAPDALGIDVFTDTQAQAVTVAWDEARNLADLAPISGADMYYGISFTHGLSVALGPLELSSPDANTTTVLFSPQGTVYVEGLGGVGVMGASTSASFSYAPDVSVDMTGAPSSNALAFDGQIIVNGPSYEMGHLTFSADEIVVRQSLDSFTMGVNGSGALEFSNNAGSIALPLGTLSARSDIDNNGLRTVFIGKAQLGTSGLDLDHGLLADIVSFDGDLELYGEVDTANADNNKLYLTSNITVADMNLLSASLSMDSQGLFIRGVTQADGMDVGVEVEVYASGGQVHVRVELIGLDGAIEGVVEVVETVATDIAQATADVAQGFDDLVSPQSGTCGANCLTSTHGFLDIKAFGAGHNPLGDRDTIKAFCQDQAYYNALGIRDGDYDDGLGVDLNAGVQGAQFIYYCVKYAGAVEAFAPVKRVAITSWSNPDTTHAPTLCARDGFGHDNTSRMDLNDEAGGRYLFSCVDKNPITAPITQLKAVASSSYSTAVNACTAGGFSVVRRDGGSYADLNESVGGTSDKWVFLCTKTD